MVSARCHVDILELIVEDNGKGLGNLKDIFHKFSRNITAGTAGSGLGLSIVKGFTEALGGDVEAFNPKTGGARFEISIPVQTKYYQ